MVKAFHISLVAGIAFIAIGTASVIYSTTPVDVSLDGKLRSGLIDVLTPDMNVGNTATVTLGGSEFSVSIFDPDNHLIRSENGTLNFSYTFTAQKAGVHKIQIKNTGNSELTIGGHAQTKGSFLEFSAQMMLIITGVIVIAIGLRLKGH